MSAFGRRSGGGGGNGTAGRPQFGIAQPMKGPAPVQPGQGGSQFPPIEPETLGADDDSFAAPSGPVDRGDAMARLADRQAQSGEQGSSRNEGFEASIHRIKEQVLPRLLERVDPEAAATLSKDELAEEFRPIIDEEHLLQIAQRIVNKVGRRVDQTTPLADARLQDGSRVNVIIPPLSLRGTAISIRKFSEKPITVDMMRGFGSMSEKMATVLKIAGACRMNIIISGGTGSGKTTMLNALSKLIDPGERVLTIEDAAELRLQQPHWLPLETRPPPLEGQAAIPHRHLGT